LGFGLYPLYYPNEGGSTGGTLTFLSDQSILPSANGVVDATILGLSPCSAFSGSSFLIVTYYIDPVTQITARIFPSDVVCG
jgi:hypothetical protein